MDMRVDIVTKEYPPEIYGGAGVHVTELVTALRDAHRCAGARLRLPRDEADAARLRRAAGARRRRTRRSRRSGTDLEIAGDVEGADVVHCHTWYANFAGISPRCAHGIPHVVTAHSLEPLRPWKAEQLGGGYGVSSYIEKTAYEGAAAIVAVSDGMRRDILRSYPALDPEQGAGRLQRHRRRAMASGRRPEVLRGVRHRPGAALRRVRRPHHAAEGLAVPAPGRRLLPPDVQLVLCAGAPDTPQIMAEVQQAVTRAPGRARRRRLDRPAAVRDELCAVLTARHDVRLPVGLRAARNRQPRGDGCAAPRWWARRPAASPRSSPTGSPDASCRSSRSRTAPARRSIPIASSPTSQRSSPRSSPIPERARRWAQPAASGRRATSAGARIAERTLAIYRSLL